MGRQSGSRPVPACCGSIRRERPRPCDTMRTLAGCGKTRGQTNLSLTSKVESGVESMLGTDPSVPVFFRNLLVFSLLLTVELTAAGKVNPAPNPAAERPVSFRLDAVPVFFPPSC